MDVENTGKRKYELKKRAAGMAETRRQITQAAVELHGTVGPARTTMSAIAQRAGVQRHTVYRHFPSDEALFEACSAHYFAAHPLPDLESWRAIGELYVYYRRTERMLGNVLRDAEILESLRPSVSTLHGFVAEAADILAVGRPVAGREERLLTAALLHALDFHTWRSLTRDHRLTDDEAIELMLRLVADEDGSGEATVPRRAAAPSEGAFPPPAPAPTREPPAPGSRPLPSARRL